MEENIRNAKTPEEVKRLEERLQRLPGVFKVAGVSSNFLLGALSRLGELAESTRESLKQAASVQTFLDSFKDSAADFERTNFLSRLTGELPNYQREVSEAADALERYNKVSSSFGSDETGLVNRAAGLQAVGVEFDQAVTAINAAIAAADDVGETEKLQETLARLQEGTQGTVVDTEKLRQAFIDAGDSAAEAEAKIRALAAADTRLKALEKTAEELAKSFRAATLESELTGVPTGVNQGRLIERIGDVEDSQNDAERTKALENLVIEVGRYETAVLAVLAVTDDLEESRGFETFSKNVEKRLGDVKGVTEETIEVFRQLGAAAAETSDSIGFGQVRDVGVQSLLRSGASQGVSERLGLPDYVNLGEIGDAAFKAFSGDFLPAIGEAFDVGFGLIGDIFTRSEEKAERAAAARQRADFFAFANQVLGSAPEGRFQASPLGDLRADLEKIGIDDASIDRLTAGFVRLTSQEQQQISREVERQADETLGISKKNLSTLEGVVPGVGRALTPLTSLQQIYQNLVELGTDQHTAAVISHDLADESIEVQRSVLDTTKAQLEESRRARIEAAKREAVNLLQPYVPGLLDRIFPHFVIPFTKALQALPEPVPREVIDKVLALNLPQDVLRDFITAVERPLKNIDRSTREMRGEISFDRLSSILGAGTEALQELLRNESDSPLREWLDTRQGILRLFAGEQTDAFLVGGTQENARRQRLVQEQQYQQGLGPGPSASVPRPVAPSTPVPRGPAGTFINDLRRILLAAEQESAGAVSVEAINQLLERLKVALTAESVTDASLRALIGSLTEVFDKLNILPETRDSFTGRLEQLVKVDTAGQEIPVNGDAFIMKLEAELAAAGIEITPEVRATLDKLSAALADGVISPEEFVSFKTEIAKLFSGVEMLPASVSGLTSQLATFVREPILVDKQGQVMYVDKQGQVVLVDTQGQKILVNLEGQKLTVDIGGQKITVDLQGQTIKVDKQGQTMTVDIAGQVMTVDVGGQTIKVDLESQKITVDKGGQVMTVDIEGQTMTVDIGGQKITVDLESQTVKVDTEGQVLTVDLQNQTIKVDKAGQVMYVDLQAQTMKVDKAGQVMTVDLQGQTVKVDPEKQTLKVDTEEQILKVDLEEQTLKLEDLANKSVRLDGSDFLLKFSQLFGVGASVPYDESDAMDTRDYSKGPKTGESIEEFRAAQQAQAAARARAANASGGGGGGVISEALRQLITNPITTGLGEVKGTLETDIKPPLDEIKTVTDALDSAIEDGAMKVKFENPPTIFAKPAEGSKNFPVWIKNTTDDAIPVKAPETLPITGSVSLRDTRFSIDFDTSGIVNLVIDELARRGAIGDPTLTSPSERTS